MRRRRVPGIQKDRTAGAVTASRSESIETDKEFKIMALLEQWHAKAYNEKENKGVLQKLWQDYFAKEKEIYAQILEKDGINDSLKEKNPIEEMEEDTVVNLGFDLTSLYKNMVAAGADWLYNLPQWEPIFTEEKRKELYLEQKKSGTVVKGPKIYPNDPCPCGSGKKYKKCHGRNR